MNSIPHWSLAAFVIAVVGSSLLWRRLLKPATAKEFDDIVPPPQLSSGLAVNPWEQQRILMRVSGQTIGDIPQVNKGSLLYVALILEEVGELCKGMEGVCEVKPDAHFELHLYRQTLRQLKQDLAVASVSLRQNVKNMGPFHFPLIADRAVELLDAATDINVVACGFSLSCGFPGAEAYDEVVSSNLSKANPQTGVIDKTPDGKWIKGMKYFEPDLLAVFAGAGFFTQEYEKKLWEDQ